MLVFLLLVALIFFRCAHQSNDNLCVGNIEYFHGKCVRTVFTHKLVKYRKLNE